MASLPAVSGERAVRAFQKVEWIKYRQYGSQVILIKPGNPASLSVPQHRELSLPARSALIRPSGMSVAQFVALL
jgi:predicted RNA binding protein YcfA (HicA-like mRNA interferase family)